MERRPMLTSRDAEFAIAIREAGKGEPPFIPNNELWEYFTDLAQAIARILGIVRGCLGSEEEFNRVREHHY